MSRLCSFLAAVLVLSVTTGQLSFADIQDWQQDVHYFIDAELDANTHILTGYEKIVYTNHSPDTLNKVYFNLYANAFRKHSNMRHYQDQRYSAFGGSWMGLLPEYALGEMEILSVSDGEDQILSHESDDTILSVLLAHPLLPGKKCILRIEFRLRIPVLIRRMGRHNREGVDYTLAQWYPKVCVYGREGWHLDYYLGREFFGEIGTYEISITLPEHYIVGATGCLLNAANPEVMLGIPADSTSGFRLLDSVRRKPDLTELPDSLLHSNLSLDEILSNLETMAVAISPKEPLRTWRYRQERVHDFAWCADPDYVSADTLCGETRVRILHLPDVSQQWRPVKSWVCGILKYMEENVGPFPYPDLTVAQAGDGGMEYPSIAFITGRRGEYSLASVTAHEVIHNWFYGALANDEVHEAWLDEGMTSYYTTRVMESMFGRFAMKESRTAWPFRYKYADDARIRTFSDYEWWAKQGYEEPVLKHADLFLTDESYGYSAYTKGHVFMNALEYYFGKNRFDELMKKYFKSYAYRHVSTQTLRTFMERESGTDLSSWFDQWLKTTGTCDYGIGNISESARNENGLRFYETRIQLHRKGSVIMPVDVYIQEKNGQWLGFRIPSHPTDPDIPELERRPVWNRFTDSYTLIIELGDAVERVVIDTSHLLPDVHRSDNMSGLLPPIDWSFQKPWRRPPATDVYRVEYLPSLWFNHPDGLRLDSRFQGVWAVDEHRLKTELYYGIRSRRPGYRFEYRTPIYSAGRQVELSLQSCRLEGRTEQDVSVNKKWFGAGYDYPPYHTLKAGLRYARLYDDDYLPAGIRWDRGHQTSFYMNYRFRPGYRKENRLDGAMETSFLHSEQQYVKFDMTFQYTIPWITKFVNIRSRSFFGYSTGSVPSQSRFYLAGASPQEMFRQPLYRSAGTLPRDVWIRGQNRHWHLDGGGSMTGYYNADISTKKILTQSFEFTVPNIFYLMISRDLLILNRSEPFIFTESGLFWKENRSLFRHFRDAVVFDAGAGFIYRMSFIPEWMGRYQFRFECPFWVSRPSLNNANEKQFKKRWVVGLTVELD